MLLGCGMAARRAPGRQLRRRSTLRDTETRYSPNGQTNQPTSQTEQHINKLSMLSGLRQGLLPTCKGRQQLCHRRAQGAERAPRLLGVRMARRRVGRSVAPR